MPTRDIIITVLIFLTGAAMLWMPVKARLLRSRAMTWPKTRGRILSSAIVEDSMRTATGQVGTGFYPRVTYTYSVAGKEYTGERISFGDLRLNYTDAENVKSKFNVDDEVDVSYNPEDPAEAALAPQAKRGLKSLIPGIFLFACGLIVIILAIIF
jgi:hypothetical protein